MKNRHVWPAVILVTICLCGCVAVFATQWWMTDDTGNVDAKDSITEPPR